MARHQTSKPVYEGTALRIEFYQSTSGDVPAEEWLDNQQDKIQHKFAALFAWIGDHGKILCFFFTGRRLILTHGFLKKSNKTPPGEIERAEAFKSDFLKREIP